MQSSAASFSTFSGMHTNEDLSAAQAKMEQAALGEDDDDEIVQEIPIVLSQELAHTLYLIQSPLRPPHRPYDSELGARVSLRVKPVQKKMEMQYRLEEAGVMYQHGVPMSHGIKSEMRGHNFDEDHEYGNVKTVTLEGKSVQPKTNYCAGVLSQGVLHLTPISAVCRFRPKLDYIDEAAAAAAASSEAAREAHRTERMLSGRMTEEEELAAEEEEYQRLKEEEQKKELQTVVMKVDRKRGGAAAAAAAAGAPGAPGAGGVPGAPTEGRSRKGYAFIKQLEDSEPYVPLRWNEVDSPASVLQYHRLLSNTAPLPSPIPFNVPAQLYLSYVNPPDSLDASSSERSMVATGDPLYLSFEERLVHFMRNARLVHLKDLARRMQIGSPQMIEVALGVLQQTCWLVQGCWVIKSCILFDRSWRPGMPVPHPLAAVSTTGGGAGMSGNGGGAFGRSSMGGMPGSNSTLPLADRVHLAREYLLTQFAHHPVLQRDAINALTQLPLEPLETLFDEFARVVELSEEQLRQQGMAQRMVWQWKLEPDQDVRRYFPKECAAVESQFAALEPELKALLSARPLNPSGPAGRVDPATRGLQLTHSNFIVHAMAPAGLTANRAQPNQLFEPSKEGGRQASAGAGVMTAPSGPSLAAGQAPLSADEVASAWASHLDSLFTTHSILHNSFVQQQLSSTAALAAAPAAALTALQAQLSVMSTPFGPLSAMLMRAGEGGRARGADAAHRSTLAGLFASAPSVSTAAMRAALPKSVSDDRRREMMKEFAVYHSQTQTWTLRPGQPGAGEQA